MTSKDVKELYMASSMEELNKKMNKNIEHSTPRLLGRSSNALFLAAKDAAMDRDEEKAYVLYMRFLELVKKIRSSKEYKSKKSEYDKLVPVQKIKSALEEAEKLSESLRERYTLPQEKRPKLDADQPQGGGVVDQNVPKAVQDGKKPLSAEDVYRRNSSAALVPQQPSMESTDVAMATGASSHSPTITPNELFSLLKSSPGDILVLDCRPRAMFLSSHPDGKKLPQWLSVPEEMAKQGINSDSITKFLSGSGKKQWKEREKKSAIVLVDAASTAADLTGPAANSLPIVQLRDAIYKYDTTVQLAHPPLCLDGGYTQWHLHYSPMCVGVWKWEREKVEGRKEGEGGGGDKKEGSEFSTDYPSFPEFSELPEDEATPTLPDQTTPTRVELAPVTMDEATPVPSNETIPLLPSHPTQVVPSSPLPPAPHVLPPQMTYNPPPVMTILSLDDPNLNHDDPVLLPPLVVESHPVHFGNVPPQMQNVQVPQQMVPSHFAPRSDTSQPSGLPTQFFNGPQQPPNQAQNFSGPPQLPFQPVHAGQPIHSQQPPPAITTSHPDPEFVAKIQELEQRLAQLQEASKEEERARQTQEERGRVELERERRRLAEEGGRLQEQLMRERERVEEQRQLLDQERAHHQRRMEEEVRQFQELKTQFEMERSKVMKESEQLKQLFQLQRGGQENQRTFAVNQGLLAGWEKRLDRTTGRFYYVDHNTRTTHWNPPSNWMAYQEQAQRLREQQVPQQPGVPGKIPAQTPQQVGVPGKIPAQTPQQMGVPPGQSPQQLSGPGKTLQQVPPVAVGQIPHSTGQRVGVPGQISTQPPIQTPYKQQPPTSVGSVPASQTAQPASLPQTKMEQSQEPRSVPTVDRSTKPQAPVTTPTPTVDRRNKPTMSAAMHKRKVNNLQPVYAARLQCHALTGLRNLGNTCFMNSTLQCLTNTTQFVTYFLRGNYRNDINRSNPLGRGGMLAEEFYFLVKSMWSGQYRYISPRDFKDTISRFVPTFSGNQQQDSQEFLAFLLDGLHEDLNRVTQKQYIEEPDYRGVRDEEAAKLSWSLHKKRNNSIIVDLFQGQFRSTLKCLTCQNRSVTFEAFMYLSVPLPPGNGHCTLKDCIKLFTKEERVSGSNKWFCSVCKQHRDASKRIQIWKLPPVLLIHLKRFSYEGVWRQKKQNFVDFPFSGLDMSPDVVGVRDGLEKYDLFGVSNHFGTLTGGHYTAFCLNPYSRKFYCFDDQEVKEASRHQVKSAAAYLLFYTSIDRTPPKTIF